MTIHSTAETPTQLQHAIAHEIERALRDMSPGYFRIPGCGHPCFISPEGQMSWRDQSGRQVVVTVQVARLDSDPEPGVG